jgi:pimeloyl-ACP methyl ester carboxylesterase
MNSSGFKFTDRGREKTLVLIPGWASDARVFGALELDYNYLIPEKFSPFSFIESLADEIVGLGYGRVSLFGWSLGAFLAADFACRYPEAVDAVFLVGARKKYPLEDLERIRGLINKDRRAFLTGFYRDFFSPGEEGGSWFRKNLMKAYLEEMGSESLQEGLDYLSQSVLADDVRNNGNTRFVHGELDKIAPFKELSGFLDGSGADLIKVGGAGHMPFLDKSFRDMVNR